MKAASPATARAAVIFGSCASDHFLNPLVPLFIEIPMMGVLFLKLRIQYMGLILEIVLNNFLIVGKISSRLFRAVEFTRKRRDDFFDLISDNHGLTRTFSSQLRGLVSLSLVQGHALFWGVMQPLNG
jgi:hypothetical protein